MPTLQSLLFRMPDGMSKLAGPENPDQNQLEQDFSRLAYTFLQDRAPGLVPYLLGFEVVEREDDGSKAVGIFGIKLGKTFYYVPSFFINGQIKGMDLLYAKEINMFMPLRESWINYIVNKQTLQLGDAVKENPMDLRRTFESPNFDYLFKPPLYPGVKRGSTVDSVCSDLADAWNCMQTTLAAAMEKDAQFQAAYLGALSKLEHLPIEKSANNSALIDWLQKRGGVPAVNALMRELTTNFAFAKAAMTFYPNVDSLFVTEFDASLAPQKQAAKLEIQSEVTEYPKEEKARKRVITRGFNVVDRRDPAEKSEIYEVEYQKRFSSPQTPGKYNVLLRTGAVAPAWVLMPGSANKKDGCVVVSEDQRRCFMADPDSLFVRGEIVEGPSNVFDKAISIEKMEIGGKYIMVGPHGEATRPVEIRDIIAENDKRLRMNVYACYGYGHPEGRETYGKDFDGRILDERGGRGYPDSNFANNMDGIQFSSRHTQPAWNGSTLIVPSTWKALEIKKDEDEKVINTDKELFKPGKLSDVMEALEKQGVHKLLVGSDDRGLEFYIRLDDQFADHKQMPYKTACVRLMAHFGLGVDDAEDMLTEAAESFKSRRLVKFAQLPGVAMPYPPPPVYSSDYQTGATVTYPQVDLTRGQNVGVTPPQYSLAPGFNLGGEAQQDLQSAQTAVQAGQAGQKQVFDHSVIGGLAKMYDIGAVVDTYVPDMMQALDKLGRVLFLFYWKNEEFVERYGAEDMAELEDTIRGVFKNFGDLVLKLKQKAIESEDTNDVILS